MPKPKLISKLSLQLPNFWLMFPMLCKLSQPQSGKGDLLMVLGQSLLPRRGTLPRGKPSLVSCLLKAFSSSGQAQGLLPLWSLFWLLQFTMIIFLSEPFLNLDSVVLVTHNMLFFSFLCLNSPTHLSSGGWDPVLPWIPSSDMLPSLKASPALTRSGSLFCLGYQSTLSHHCWRSHPIVW